jgi:predicted nucleic acid-binding protein
MKLEDLVLIDTCMWVPFFNRPQSRTKQTIDELLDEDRGALVGPIVTEILCGFRHDAEADWVSSVLRGTQYLEVTWEDWRNAAKLGRQLAARGHVLPVSDLALATVARRYHCAVYSTDPHFDLVPELKRFTPEG